MRATTIIGGMVACSLWSCVLPAANQAGIGPVETTVIYRGLEEEGRVADVDANALNLVRAVLEDATKAALRVSRLPNNESQAIAVLEAIQDVMERSNFLQPADVADWPNTLGAAYRPLKLTKEKMAKQLAYPGNMRRREKFDMTKPFYFVDCDTGSMLFLSIGQRLGWDIRMVNIPKHSFVQWLLPNGTVVSWDWAKGHPFEPGEYNSGGQSYSHLVGRGVYLAPMKPEQALAHLMGLVGSEAKDDDLRVRLLSAAVEANPNDAIAQNNFAWTIATSQRYRHKASLATTLSLAALSATPKQVNRVYTLGCTFAAAGEKEVALALIAYAQRLSGSPDDDDTEAIARIKAGGLCKR